MNSDDRQLSDREVSSSDAVVRGVIRGLYEGRFEPGQRLAESELTRLFRSSRGPVREALNKLAALGVVDLTLQRGGSVRLLTVREALDTLIVCQSLVGLAARLAASNLANEDGRRRLQEVTSSLLAFDPASSGLEFATSRDQFYALIVDLAENSHLKQVMPTVQIHLIRTQFRSFLNQTNASRRLDYRRIADAVLDGRPREAESAVRIHFDRAIAALRMSVGD